MEFVIAATAGIVFSFLTTVMLFSLIKNARAGIVYNRAYLIPCFSAPLTLISFLVLNDKMKGYENYLLYVCVGAVLCIVLYVCYHMMLSKFDRGVIREQYPADIEQNNAPWYYIAICSAISAVSSIVLLGWFINICFGELSTV